MAKEAKKIRITKGQYWSEGREGEEFETYGTWEDADGSYYLVDPDKSSRKRLVHEDNCEVVAEPTDIPHGATTAPFEEDFPEYADHIAGDSTPNMVDSPPHYNAGKYEVIDIIEDSLRDIAGGFEAYCLGNVEKYTKRYRHKNGVEDLRKAAWYLNKAIEHIEARS